MLGKVPARDFTEISSSYDRHGDYFRRSRNVVWTYNHADEQFSFKLFGRTISRFTWIDRSLTSAFRLLRSSFAIRTKACASTWTSSGSAWSAMSRLHPVSVG